MSAVSDYREARAAQDQRFNNRPGAGSVDVSMTHTDEYRQFFGVGEFAGGGVEERVTFRSVLQTRAVERRAADTAERVEPAFNAVEAMRLPGGPLRWLAGEGDPVAVAELERREALRRLRRESRQVVFA